ncbi:hypothetical protein OXIME_000290 [Oxyplasma meridianum]|uniref:Uncharacterized protein n=1 Tax=Oxyplasma meridianum TaxID=3073602 RepID=A0AAX4NF80_9ARCH
MKINGKDHGMQYLKEFTERVGKLATSNMIWKFLAQGKSKKDKMLYDLLNEVASFKDGDQEKIMMRDMVIIQRSVPIGGMRAWA